VTEHVKIIKDAGILTLVLDRPAKKNALTDAMYRVLADELERSEQDPATRVVLIRAEGEMFTSGSDVNEFAAVAMGAPVLPNVGRFLRALSLASKPVVAAVQGRAIGIGTTMLLHCDHVIVADNAQLSTPFVNLALVPEAASTLLMPMRIGHARAFEMFALGDAMDANTAQNLGIANRVVPLDKLYAEAAGVAARLAKLPAGSLSATKRLMRDAAVLTAQIGAESECFAERLKTAEAREAFTAFAERRPPDFRKVA
jgi:enoyl-CoA hydratase/carnithine racemase